MSWLEPLTRSRLYGIIAVSVVSASVTYAVVDSLVISPLRDRLAVQAHQTSESGGRGPELVQVEKELASCRQALSAVGSPRASATEEALATQLASPPGGPVSGIYDYQQQIANLHIPGNSSLSLTLETIRHEPGRRLTFNFLVENPTKNLWELKLSNPEDAAFVLDDRNGEHAVVATENIEATKPLKVPIYARRRFSVSFTAIAPEVERISLRISFDLTVHSHFSGSNIQLVELGDIFMNRFNPGGGAS